MTTLALTDLRAVLLSGAAQPAAQMRHLRPADLLIVVVYLVGITLFGLRFRKRKDTSLRGYFLAGRTIPWWAISLSIVSAETSTLTIISVPGLAFAGDLGFLQIVLGYMLGRVLIAFLFLPRYARGELLTAYQLIDQRFGPTLHKITAGLFLLTRAAAEGVRVFAVSIVVAIAIGTGNTTSIALISALTLLYTFEGGMAAVVWTDVVQMTLYIAGTLIALFTLNAHTPGGWSVIYSAGSAAGKFHVLHFGWNLAQSYTFWAGLLGGAFLTMASHGTDQLMVQRLLAARNLRESRAALLSSGVVVFVQFALFLLIGVGLFVFYGGNGAPFGSTDRIFPSFIVREMPTGVAGLLVAAILAAAMSNLSAALNSLASTSVVDFWMHWRPAAGDRARLRVSRMATVFWTLVLFLIAVYSVHAGGRGHVVEIGLSIASVAYGALLGVFLLGTLVPFASEAGAGLGMVAGFVTNLVLWLAPGQRVAGLPVPRVAFTWFVLIGSLVTVVVGVLASLVVGSAAGRRVRGAALVLFLAASSGGLHGQALQHSEATPTKTSFADVDTAIASAIAARKLPGAVVLIGHGGTVVYQRAYGERAQDPAPEPMTIDTIFDMASLTKCMVTASAVMQLYEEGRLGLDDRVSQYLPEFATNGKEAVTVRELLTHYSGLPPDVVLTDAWSGKQEGFRRAMTSGLTSAPGTTFRYSDINFVVLGALVERLSGLPLQEYAQKRIFDPLGMRETRYLPPASWRARIAPTAHNDDGPMGDDRLLRGEVHDPTARRMGDVAGHAGVFSTAHDVSLFAQALLDRLAGRPSRFPLRRETLLLMTTPQQPGHTPEDLRQPAASATVTYPTRKDHSVRGLGWDLDSAFSRPRGTVFPLSSFGHTGFTGTSLWLDPGSDTYVVLLANAIHPRGRPAISALRGEVATGAGKDLRLYRCAAVATCQDMPSAAPSPAAAHTRVLTGIDVLEATHFQALRELARAHGGTLRAGLLTNQTGLDAAGQRSIDVLRRDARAAVPGFSLEVLFSPEHGLAGSKDSLGIGNSVDSTSHLRVISLYGAHEADRRPRAEDLASLDLVIVDLQDAGVRFYTYETVTGYFVEACAKAHLPLMVLDRPPLLDGEHVQGPVSDAGRESYTDYMPMPVRHGMTLAELANFINLQKKLGAVLTPVLMQNWHRSEFYDETGVPWVNPSPNLRTQAAAVLYPGVALTETTNLSVGRGTEMPFEVFGAGREAAETGGASGAAWFHADEVVNALSARSLPGVRFEATHITVADDENHYPFHGQTIEAVRLRVTDRELLDSPELGIEMITALRRLYPERFHWRKTPLIANRETTEAIAAGQDPRTIAETWTHALESFRQERAGALLYPEP